LSPRAGLSNATIQTTQTRDLNQYIVFMQINLQLVLIVVILLKQLTHFPRSVEGNKRTEHPVAYRGGELSRI